MSQAFRRGPAVPDELHPRVVAGVIDDVGRRVDQPSDDPPEAAMEALEQLGRVAEQPRSWCWVLGPQFGTSIGPVEP
jgi:hypothetical protein